jgi:DNA-directed RNA polymerase specialized sigma24 family protein
VINFFRRKGCSPEDSRDLTQEVFSRVFKAIDTFRRLSELPPGSRGGQAGCY